MINLDDLRTRPEAYQKAAEDKRCPFDVQEFLELDARRRELRGSTEELRAKLNSLSKEVPKRSGDEQVELRAELRDLSAEVKESNRELVEVEEQWKRDQLFIPAIPLDGVPIGKDDTENRELREWGELPRFDFTPKDHLELGTELGMIDMERGAKVAGARSYFLCGDGARLHHAVLNCAIEYIRKKGYTLVEPPHIVRYDAMMGTGYFPGGEEMAYHLDERDDTSYLIGTSEVPLVAYRANEVLAREDLPLRYAGYSPCYRREAGSYGKDTKGLYRVHQFYKVEQVVLCEADPEISRQLHLELLSSAEEFVQLLELPYRVVEVCTGDIGQGQAYKNDIETWMPSREAYAETHSCSTLYDFQSRRLQIRYKNAAGKNTFCHTLNNTLIASPRVLIPLMEVHQNADGSIRIPKVLQPYMGGRERIGP